MTTTFFAPIPPTESLLPIAYPKRTAIVTSVGHVWSPPHLPVEPQSVDQSDNSLLVASEATTSQSLPFLPLLCLAVGSVLLAASQAFIRSGLGYPPDFWWFIASTWCLYATTVALSVLALGRGRVLWGLFTLAQLIVPGSIFAFQCALGTPFSNWREQAISYYGACGAIIGLNHFIAAMNVISAWEVYRRPVANVAPVQRLHLSRTGSLLFWAISLAAVAGMLSVMRGTRDAFLNDASVGDKFIVRAAFGCCTFLFACLLRSRGIAQARWLTVLYFAAGLILAMLGFRYFLFNLLVTVAVTMLVIRPPSARTFAVLGISAPIVYFLLLVGAYTRQANQPVLESLVNIFTGRVSLNDLLEYAGGNEQCTFYTWYCVEGKHYYSFGEYYWISLLRTLPQWMYLPLSEDLRYSFGHYLKELCAPKWFLDNDLTLGGYYFVEASVNFGWWGPYLMLLVAYWWTLAMERFRERVQVGELLYTLACGSVYLLVLYGSENFLKPFWVSGSLALLVTTMMLVRSKGPELLDSEGDHESYPLISHGRPRQLFPRS